MPLIINQDNTITDTGTGKTQTASERGEERIVQVAPQESAGKVTTRSEKGETTLEQSTEVGPRREVAEGDAEATYTAPLAEARAQRADEDKAVHLANTKKRAKKAG